MKLSLGKQLIDLEISDFQTNKVNDNLNRNLEQQVNEEGFMDKLSNFISDTNSKLVNLASDDGTDTESKYNITDFHPQFFWQ